MIAKQKKEVREVLMTPVGTAMFPYLNHPAPPFNDAKDKPPSWKVTLKLKTTDPGVPEFLANLQARYDANLAQAEVDETPKARAQRLKSKNPSLGADLPWKPEIDDAGSETGCVLMNLKQGAYAISKKDGQRYDFFVDLFDAKGARIDREKVKIGGGSRVACAFEVNTFFTEIGAGLSLRLKAVQVIERVEWQGKDAAGYGFKPQDGFAVEEVASMDAGDGDEAITGDPTDDSI